MRRGVALAALSCVLFCAWWLVEDGTAPGPARGTTPERALATDRGDANGPDPDLVAAKRREVMRRIGKAVFWLDVIVVDPAGEPRPGVRVWLRQRGRDGPIDRRVTDEDGTVRFDPRPGEGRFEVMVDPGDGYPAFRAETWDADLEHFDPVRVVLPDAVEFRLQVTVDGRRELPRGFRLRGPRVLDPELDFARGEVRGRIHPSAFGPIEADAPDLLVTHSSVHRCTNEICEADLGFSSTIRVTIRLLGSSEFATDVGVQQPGRLGGWDDAPGDLDIEFGDEVTILTRTLPAGRYRIATSIGLALREFELLPTARDPVFVIDLRDASWAEPHVVLPDDLMEKLDSFHESICCRLVEADRVVQSDHAVLHPGDRPLTFVVDTPLLEPDPAKGMLRTDRGGRFDLLARVAPLVRFRWPATTIRRTLTIQLFRDGRAVRRPYWATKVGDAFCFSAPPPGRYDLVIWHQKTSIEEGWAPAVYRDLRIDGATDLGTLRAPERGSRLTVQIRNPPRRAARYVYFELKDPPFVMPGSVEAMYEMFRGGSLADSGATAWTKSHVPRGTILVRVTAGDREWTREVECDGKTDRAIGIDCESR